MAVEWREAAEAGDISAQFNLGLSYAQGSGVQRSLGEVMTKFLYSNHQNKLKNDPLGN